jgi:hypothetical protein
VVDWDGSYTCRNTLTLVYFKYLFSFILTTQYYSMNLTYCTVPDLGSRDRDVVLVRRVACRGNPKGGREFGMGGTGEDLGRGRSVYEQPGTKVDRVASRQRRVSK